MHFLREADVTNGRPDHHGACCPQTLVCQIIPQSAVCLWSAGNSPGLLLLPAKLERWRMTEAKDDLQGTNVFTLFPNYRLLETAMEYNLTLFSFPMLATEFLRSGQRIPSAQQGMKTKTSQINQTQTGQSKGSSKSPEQRQAPPNPRPHLQTVPLRGSRKAGTGSPKTARRCDCSWTARQRQWASKTCALLAFPSLSSPEKTEAVHDSTAAINNSMVAFNSI